MKSPRKILVFRQSSLGDVILTLPVLDRLKEAFPDSGIDYVTKTQYKPIVEFHPSIGRVFSFASGDEFGALVDELRHIGYDLFIDLQSNLRSHYLGIRLSVAATLRYKKRRLAREIIVRRPGLRLSVDHTVEAYLKSLRKLGIAAEVKPPILHLPPEAIAFGDGYCGDIRSKDKTIIAFCPGARHHEKKWPWENYRDLALLLLEKPEIVVLVFSSSTDDLPGNPANNPRIIQVKDIEITRAAAVLSKCSVAVTNDSGLMHLASSVGTPVVAIFGPTHPRLGFAPTLPGSKVICDDVPCSPCSLHGQRKCYQPRKFCFEKITPERIHRELLGILKAR